MSGTSYSSFAITCILSLRAREARSRPVMYSPPELSLALLSTCAKQILVPSALPYIQKGDDPGLLMLYAQFVSLFYHLERFPYPNLPLKHTADTTDSLSGTMGLVSTLSATMRSLSLSLLSFLCQISHFVLHHVSVERHSTGSCG